MTDDIKMCSSTRCHLKDNCLRATAQMAESQEWFIPSPYSAWLVSEESRGKKEEEYTCEHFVKNK